MRPRSVYAKDLNAASADAYFDATMAHLVAADRFGNYLEGHGAAALLQFWLEVREYDALRSVGVPPSAHPRHGRTTHSRSVQK